MNDLQLKKLPALIKVQDSEITKTIVLLWLMLYKAYCLFIKTVVV